VFAWNETKLKERGVEKGIAYGLKGERAKKRKEFLLHVGRRLGRGNEKQFRIPSWKTFWVLSYKEKGLRRGLNY